MTTRHYPKAYQYSALALLIATSLQVQAQDDNEKGAKPIIETIEVTARKRSESLQDVPVAVTALISDDVEKRGIVQVSDLADQTPGLVISDSASGKTDRSVQTLSIRGFSPSSGSSATASMFIDGVPVSSTTAISSIGSPERIEILRGPQSAYFGRNTFAGALNIVNKSPNEEWAGSVEAIFGNYNFKRFRGDVEGVVIEDKLSFRLSGETYDKEGAWKNAGTGGGTFGDQSTDMVNLYIEANPTQDLSIKAFGLYSSDEDGPAASAFVSAYDITDSEGNVLVQGQANCELNGNPYFCSPVVKADPFAYNTQAPAELKDVLSNISTNRVTSTSMLNDYGMTRKFKHFHLVADWEVGDFILSSLTGYNREQWILLNDIDHYESDTFNYGFLVERDIEDISQEFRVTYDGDGPFSGTFGLSYLDATKDATQTSVINSFIPSQVVPTGRNEAETIGAFFGTSYEFTDQLTLSVEGRFQRDTITAIDTVVDAELASESFDNFLPRVILDYSVARDTTMYASYSKGINPAVFNLGLSALSDYAQETAASVGITLVVEPEEVDNFEIGLKGSALGGSLTYASAVYYAQWSKQINQGYFVFTEPGNDMATALEGVTNAGALDLYGLEFESNWAATENIRVNLAAAYTGSDIKEYSDEALTLLTGTRDFSGNEQPGVSKYSGNLGVEYRDTIGTDYDYFLRADYIYKSGQWTNQANFMKTNDISKVNIRAGVNIGDLQIQAYVNNLFENDEYTSVYDYYAFTPTFAYFSIYSGVVMGLPEPRTIGVQFKYSFYE